MSQWPLPHGVCVSAYLLHSPFYGQLSQDLNLHEALQLQITHDLAVLIAKVPSLSFPQSPQRSLSDLVHLFLAESHLTCLHPISYDYRLLGARQSLSKVLGSKEILTKKELERRGGVCQSSWKRQRTLPAEKTKEM